MFDLGSQAGHLGATKTVQASQAADSEVIVHVMPEQFRSGRDGRNKSAGLVIFVAGILLLLAAGGAIYYFVFMSPPGEPTPVAPTPVAATTPEPTPVAPTPVETSTAIVPAATATEPATGPAAVPIIEATTTPSVEAVAALDSDRDGLTDEEEAILGSDKGREDSDGDGFGDLVELQRGYNPAGPGKLVSNSQFKVARQTGFYLLYPSGWTQKQSGGDFALVWQAPDNQLFQLNREKLPQATTIAAWYRDRFGSGSVPDSQLIQKKDESGRTVWSGIKSQDGLVIYLLDPSGTEVFTFSYSPGLDTALKYPKLFEALVMSLTFE